MSKKQPGNLPIIKSNLKTSDRISLIYNDKEAEMSLEDFKTYLNSDTNKGYKSYVALLSQTGTNDPTAVVLENTLGGDIVWTRSLSAGQYIGTLNGAFPIEQKVCLFIQNTYSSNYIVPYLYYSDANTVSIETYWSVGASDIDGQLYNTSVEIRVYN